MIKPKKNTLLGSNLDRIINSLVGIGFDSQKENAISFILIGASVLLTIASGFTTFIGLCEYLPIFFAFLVALGIQGLLFAISWRIGAMRRSGKLKFSLFLIYIITLSTSVFFSYSALLDVIYKPAMREKEELNLAKNDSHALITDLKIKLLKADHYDSLSKVVEKGLINWQDSSFRLYQKKYQEIIHSLDRSRARHNYLVSRISSQMKILKTNPDSLNRAIYQQLMNSNAYNFQNKLVPTQSQYERVRYLKDMLDSSFNHLTIDDRSLTIKNFNSFNSIFRDFVIAIDETQRLSSINDVLKSSLGAVSETNNILNVVDNTNIDSVHDIKDLKSDLYRITSLLSSSNNSLIADINKKIGDIGEYSGSEIHHFVISIVQLQRKTFLAIGAFIIALILDILVLLCGLLGARPESYLTIKNASELDDILESSIEILLSLNLYREEPPHDPKIKRMIAILKNCRPSPELAKFGIPAVMDNYQIDELNLSSEIGVFLATGLAKKIKDKEVIGFTTVFILWLAKQIFEYDIKN